MDRPRAMGGATQGSGSGPEGGSRGRKTTSENNARRLTGNIKNCRTLRDLSQILHEQRGALNHIHVSAAWVQLARIRSGRRGGEVNDAVAALQDRTIDVLGQAGGREIANVMHSMAKLHEIGVRPDRGLLEAMQRRAMATAGEFKPQEAAIMLWALASMGERVDRVLLEAMQKKATATAGEFNPQNVANLLWALATMGEKDRKSVV